MREIPFISFDSHTHPGAALYWYGELLYQHLIAFQQPNVQYRIFLLGFVHILPFHLYFLSIILYFSDCVKIIRIFRPWIFTMWTHLKCIKKIQYFQLTIGWNVCWTFVCIMNKPSNWIQSNRIEYHENGICSGNDSFLHFELKLFETIRNI